MSFPVLIERTNGSFEATLAGVPAVKVSGVSRDEALAALQLELARQLERGDLAVVELPATGGLLSQVGSFAGDETLRDICRDAYAARDRDRDSLTTAE